MIGSVRPLPFGRVSEPCSDDVGLKLFRWYVYDRFRFLDNVSETVTFMALGFGLLVCVVYNISVGVLLLLEEICFHSSFYSSLVNGSTLPWSLC